MKIWMLINLNDKIQDHVPTDATDDFLFFFLFAFRICIVSG